LPSDKKFFAPKKKVGQLKALLFNRSYKKTESGAISPLSHIFVHLAALKTIKNTAGDETAVQKKSDFFHKYRKNFQLSIEI